ncbi:MAG TPA: cobalamin-independent methionine synthase II family protein [Stellaceae bacterium]|nr:cobalamin-independent methionine synthase II family protein [Stellaceae bacterium]
MSDSKRVLTTHTGSLPRPDQLVALLQSQHEGRPFDQEDLTRQSQAAVADCVAKQVECGVDIVSDGEMSKISYSHYVATRLSGLESPETARANGATLKRFHLLDIAYPDFPDFAADRAKMAQGPRVTMAPVCTGALSYRDMTAVNNDIATLKNASTAAGAKASFMTAASPGVVAMFCPESSYYQSEDDYVFALAEAMRPEYEAIHRSGLILQVDCPDLALCNVFKYPGTESDPLRIAARNIEAVNHAIANIPGDRVRLHLCWGNYTGPHTADLEVEKLFPVLRTTKARALSFEAANPRHEHEWEDWKRAGMPDDMVFIPGVIDSVTNFVEHPRLVAQRIRHFVDAFGADRVIAGSDCGFGTFAAGVKALYRSVVWAKLRSLRDGAAMALQVF